MIIKCAWCKEVIRRIKNDDNSTSHGICPECLKKMLDNVKRIKKEAENVRKKKP